MNIKSLLLGSAAALVAVTGARAADAPVTMVEPEPVEYVRVCDVYGTGFFYIPGTETCLKIGGYIRMRVYASDEATRVTDLDEVNDDDDDDDFDGFYDDEGLFTEVRARLDFDAREETELGTLRAKIRLQATNNGVQGVDDDYSMDEGFIQLGGLTAGYLDTIWAGDDGGISDGLLLDNDWSVGDFQGNRISYTAAFGGFSLTAGVVDDATGDFVPDVQAKISYKGGFGGAFIAGVYDEQADDGLGDVGLLSGGSGFLENDFGVSPFDVFAEADDFDGDDSAFAVKGGVQLENLIAADSILKVEGHYAFDPTVYATNEYISQQYATQDEDSFGLRNIPVEWQVGAGYQQTFGKVFAAVNGIYGELFDLDVDYNSAGVPDFNNIDGGTLYGGGINLGYQITSNFSALAEVTYREVDLEGGLDDFDQTGGFLELRRNF